MADFAIWATACETALWPSGTFARAYEANHRAMIEGVINADPVNACVRDIMAHPSAPISTATQGGSPWQGNAPTQPAAKALAADCPGSR